MSAFLSGVAAGYGIAIPVGAIAVLIVGTGIACGFRCAAFAGAGAATADLLYAMLAVIAGSAVADALEPYGTWVRWLSATVLVAIALSGLWRAGRRPGQATATSIPSRTELLRTYLRFLGLTVVNPMTVVYFTTLIVGLSLASGTAGALAFVSGAFLASLSWQLLLAAAGAAARHGLTERWRRTTTVAGNLTVLGLAATIALR